MSKIQDGALIGIERRASLRLRNQNHDAYKPSRAPVTRSRMTVRGRFPSNKMGRMIGWESQLERRACYLFEFSPLIHEFLEQPNPIQFPIADRITKYTPDFQLNLLTGETWFVEVKPLDHLHKLHIAERLSKASAWYDRNGYKFIVLTDEELVVPIVEQNLSFLRYYHSIDVCRKVSIAACDWVRHVSCPTLGGLINTFKDDAQVYALLCQHVVATDLAQPLSLDSRLFIPEDSYYAELLFSYRTAPHFGLGELFRSENP